MLDLVYPYIFGHFYFHQSSILVNHTHCTQICNDLEMQLPNANDNDLILKQLRYQFGSGFVKEISTTSNETTNRKPNKNFLVYFIGSLNIKSLKIVRICSSKN